MTVKLWLKVQKKLKKRKNVEKIESKYLSEKTAVMKG